METKQDMYIKLKQLRKKYHYTNKDMSEKLGITSSFYCQLENKKRRLSYNIAIKIAKIFNTTPDEIFYDEIPKN